MVGLPYVAALLGLQGANSGCVDRPGGRSVLALGRSARKSNERRAGKYLANGLGLSLFRPAPDDLRRRRIGSFPDRRRSHGPVALGRASRKQDVSHMDRSITAGCTVQPPDTFRGPGDVALRLRDDATAAVLVPDRSAYSRAGLAPASHTPLASIQAVANLLGPFFGERSGEVSHALIKRFGNLNAALRASPEALLKALNGHEAACAVILAAHEVKEAALIEGIAAIRLDVEDARLAEYLRARFDGSHREWLVAIFLSASHDYLGEELFGPCVQRTLRVNAVIIAKRALELDASLILIAHNHPSSRVTPSKQDLDATRKLAGLCASLGLELLDHLIVTRDEIFSIRQGETL